MRHPMLKCGLMAGAALALAVAAHSPSVAAPLSTGATALKDAVPSDVVDVRWRGRWGWGAGGFATGLALGALAARPYYYGSYYYAPPPVYYAPPPVVYGPPEPTYAQPYIDPNGPARQCWVPTDRDRGYGYYRPC